MTEKRGVDRVQKEVKPQAPCKYVLWMAIDGEPNACRTIPSHDGGVTGTRILNEGLYCADGDPEPGERLTQYKTDSDGRTLTGWSSWIIDRVETYPANLPGYQEFSEIIVCFCKFSPVDPEWSATPEPAVSLDSFGGDAEAYRNWLESQVEVTA